MTIWYAPKKICARNFFDVQDIILERKKENYLKNIMSSYKSKYYQEPLLVISSQNIVHITFEDVAASGFLTEKNCTLSADLNLMTNRNFTLSLPNKTIDEFEVKKFTVSEANNFLPILEKEIFAVKKKIIRKASSKVMKNRSLYFTTSKLRKMIREKFNVSYISLLTGINKQAIKNLIQKFKKNKPLNKQKRGRKSKITEIELNHLKEILQFDKNLLISSKSILKKWSEICGWTSKKISISHFKRILHSLSMTYKKTQGYYRAKNTESNKDFKQIFSCYLLKQISIKKKLIFIDEAGFNLQGNKNYAWSRKGIPFCLEKSFKSSNYSVIGAISEKEFIGFMIIRGPVNSELFCGFISCLIQNLLESKLCQSPEDFVLVMDNAHCHKKLLIKHIKPYFYMLWIPPYTPELNPIELLWSQLKRIVYKKESMLTESELIYLIGNSIKSIKADHIKGYFAHTVRFYSNCLDKTNLSKDEEHKRK